MDPDSIRNVSVFELMRGFAEFQYSKSLDVNLIRVFSILYTAPCLVFSFVGSIVILVVAGRGGIKLNPVSVALIQQVRHYASVDVLMWLW